MNLLLHGIPKNGVIRLCVWVAGGSSGPFSVRLGGGITTVTQISRFSLPSAQRPRRIQYANLFVQICFPDQTLNESACRHREHSHSPFAYWSTLSLVPLLTATIAFPHTKRRITWIFLHTNWGRPHGPSCLRCWDCLLLFDEQLKMMDFFHTRSFAENCNISAARRRNSFAEFRECSQNTLGHWKKVDCWQHIAFS